MQRGREYLAQRLHALTHGKPHQGDNSRKDLAPECRRVNSKLKIVRQKYLGRPGNIITAVTEHREGRLFPRPQREGIVNLGVVTSLYYLASLLDPGSIGAVSLIGPRGVARGVGLPNDEESLRPPTHGPRTKTPSLLNEPRPDVHPRGLGPMVESEPGIEWGGFRGGRYNRRDR